MEEREQKSNEDHQTSESHGCETSQPSNLIVESAKASPEKKKKYKIKKENDSLLTQACSSRQTKQTSGNQKLQENSSKYVSPDQSQASSRNDKRHQSKQTPESYDPNVYRRGHNINNQKDTKKDKYSKGKPTRRQQLFPCSFCNKEMTLEQMDTHHPKCEMAFQCELCRDFFPIALVDQHYRCCKNRKRNKGNEAPEPMVQRCQPSLRRPILKAFQAKKQQRMMFQHGYGREDWLDNQQEQILYEKMQFQQFGLKPIAEEKKVQKPWRLSNQSFNYARYRQDLYDSDREGFVDDFQNSPNKKSKDDGLNERQINRLAKNTFKKGASTEVECGICANQPEEGEQIMRLPCLHSFHSQCLVPWLRMKPLCPTCKHYLKRP